MSSSCANRMGSTLYTLAYIVGLVTSTLAADDGVHYEVVYSHPDPIQAVKGQVLTSIDIVEEMHIEMDIEVHSLYGSYPNIFTCADTNDLKMPSISLHGSGYFAIRWGTADKSDWNANVPGRGQIVAGETYHVELDMAPDSWTVTLDGVVVYDESGLGEPLTFENVPCYVSNPWFGEADVTVSNLFIGIPSEYQEVYSHPEAFLEPEQNVAITTIDIVEEMHFEMDIAVHSWRSHYKPVFLCKDGKDHPKLPWIGTHHNQRFITRWTTADSVWDYNSPKKGIVLGNTYHVEMDMAPGSWTVTVDGVVLYEGSGLGAPLSIENVPCYVYGGSIGADVTVSNLFIGIPLSSAADGSGNAAAMHSGTAEEIEHGTNGNDDHTDWIMMAVTMGALAVVAVVISVVLLMKKRNATKSAEAPSATTGHVPEVSLSAISSSTTGPEVQSVAADSMTVNVDPEASPAQISETTNGAENV